MRVRRENGDDAQASRLRDHRRAFVSLLGLAVAAFAFNMVEILPVGLLPEISRGLGLSVPQAGLLVTAYALTIAVGTVPLVTVSTRVSRRKLIIGLVATMAVATVLFVAVPAVVSVFGTRVATALAHGVMWSFMGPAAVSQYPDHLRGRVLSVLTAGGATAIVGGLPASTWIGGLIGWRAPFLIMVALGIVSVVLLAACLDDVPAESNEALRTRTGMPDVWVFVAGLAVVATSVMATFIVLTFVSVWPVQGGMNDSRLAGALTVFGISGVGAVAVFGRLLDALPRAALMFAVLLQVSGLLTLWMSTAWALLLWVGVALLGAAATAVPLACQYLVYDVAPLRVEVALALSSLAYNVGVAFGAAAGGWTIRGSSTASLIPTAVAVSSVTMTVAAVVVRRVGRAREAVPRASGA